MREAGLPQPRPDVAGAYGLLLGAKGVVRALHPERRRVDIEAEDGSLLSEVLVIGPYFPEVHADAQAPSQVVYVHVRGQPDAVCWPLPHRRLLGPQDRPADAAGQEQPERRYFHTHGYIFRHGDVTVRLTDDNRYVIETEQGDYIILDTQQRQIRLHAPHVFVGTDDEAQANRLEFEQDESFRAFNPLILLGTEVGDRIEYLKDSHITLQAPIIKMTATGEIILDPPTIKFGNENASEPLILGNTWLAFFNAFISLFNAHQHTNVQTGGGLSGPPQTAAAGMTSAQLSDIAYVSKDGL
jgi:hypothetical protein